MNGKGFLILGKEKMILTEARGPPALQKWWFARLDFSSN
jgi:hypothetical protein